VTVWQVSTWLRDEHLAETARRLWERAGLQNPTVAWVAEHRLWRLTATATGDHPGGIADVSLVGVPHTGLGIVPANHSDDEDTSPASQHSLTTSEASTRRPGWNGPPSRARPPV
jgi:hypothetical protein